MKNTVVLCISEDIPFTQRRFYRAEEINNIIILSDFRDQEFYKNYRLKMIDGPLSGLLTRAVVVLDEGRKVFYTEIVCELSREPNYKSALKSLSV